MNVVIAGGGTAGHVLPGLAVARLLRDGGHRASFIGTRRGVESRLVPAAGFDLLTIEAEPLLRTPSLSALRAPLAALRAVGECRDIIGRADCVLGVGGYASVPAVVAAKRERVPLLVHEQNVVPGLANRGAARVADRVAISFPDSTRFFPRRSPLVVTGNPVRREILRVNEERDGLEREARHELGLREGRKTVLIFGGSQGALHLDRASVGACRLLRLRSDLQVILITGPLHLRSVSRGAPADSDGVVLRMLDYLDRMELGYAAADLVVSRAGATTIAEVTACGLPAVLVPYPFATGHHQEANASALARAGAASVLKDDQLTSSSLAARIEGILDQPERMRAMADRSRRLGRPDAARSLADAVLETAGRRSMEGPR